MKHKVISDFTDFEKEMMNTIVVNHIIAQADGFQLGYAQAISDITEILIDYWNGSDDKPQQSVLDMLVDMGENLGKRKGIAERNIKEANKKGYEKYYVWEYRENDEPFTRNVPIFTKAEEEDSGKVEE